MTPEQEADLIDKLMRLSETAGKDIKMVVCMTLLGGILLEIPDRMAREDALQRFVSGLRNAVDDLARLQAAKSEAEVRAALHDFFIRDTGRPEPDPKGRRLH